MTEKRPPVVAVPDLLSVARPRVADGSLSGFLRQLDAIAGCTRPIRLVGAVDQADRATGELRRAFDSATLPDGTLLVPCGNRRASVCPSCSYLYAGDAWQIVHAGLLGGQNVPASVAGHPGLFVTLTAPSFGPVHSQRAAHGRAQRCQRYSEGRCRHGRPRCGRVHADDDPLLGQAVCRDCFDYPAAVLWNAVASRLWKRTVDLAYRRIATLAGLTEKRLRGQLRISYVKVAEMQARGLIHFHGILRLDAFTAWPGVFEPPPAWANVDLLTAAWRWAVQHARESSPHPRRSDRPRPYGEDTPATYARWGEQAKADPVAVEGGQMTPGMVAGYLAKYVTKSTTDGGALDRRIRTLDELHGVLPFLNPHQAALVRTAWELGGWPDLAPHRLRQNAHAFGYRGHWLTKSRRYSTTFAACRTVRRTWRATHRPDGSERTPLDAWGRALDEDQVVIHAAWRFQGTGYRHPGDHELATLAADQARSRREAARTRAAA